MNYYQIQPTSYIDNLIDGELYQKAGAFQNYWRLFYKYYVRDNILLNVQDKEIEHFNKRYAKRTLAKIFNVKSKDTAGKWKDEFIEVIENFIAHWKLLEMQKNDQQDNYTLKRGSQTLANEQPTISQEVATPLAKNEVNKTTENKEKNSNDENSISQPISQEVANEQPMISQEVAKLYNNNNNNNINNNIKEKKYIKKENSLFNSQTSELLNNLGVDESFAKKLIDFMKDIDKPIKASFRLNQLLSEYVRIKAILKLDPEEIFNIQAAKEWKDIKLEWVRKVTKEPEVTNNNEYQGLDLSEFGFDKPNNDDLIEINVIGGF
jgi:hypothetical protein